MEIIFLIAGVIFGVVSASFFAYSRIKGETGRVEERSIFLEKEKVNLENNLDSERQKVIELSSKLSALQSDYKNLQQKLAEQKAEVDELQQKFTKEFENLANRIFEAKGNQFTEKNKEKLNEILNPLRDKISEFEKKVEETNKESIRGHASLREQLSMLKDMNQQMSTDAQNLVKALKSDTKAQGDWGEIQLERILEKAGLRKGEEYLIQESFTTEEGRKRPDVIVNLPEEKKIIIDSKVSLVSYERFVSATDDDQRSIHIKAYIDSVKKHIKELSEKNYQSIFDYGSLDFVLMFIPIEPAYSLAIQFGDELYAQAWEKNIMIVSPMNLFIALRTIAYIWRQENQNKNALEIARQAGSLYDKFVNFYTDLLDVGKKMDSAKDSYENAMKKIHDGRGNLISGVEKIKELGAKASKSLPPAALNRDDLDDENNLLDN